jgi:hypothetical protein
MGLLKLLNHRDFHPSGTMSSRLEALRVASSKCHSEALAEFL